jgi:hypothetical protein
MITAHPNAVFGKLFFAFLNSCACSWLNLWLVLSHWHSLFVLQPLPFVKMWRKVKIRMDVVRDSQLRQVGILSQVGALPTFPTFLMPFSLNFASLTPTIRLSEWVSEWVSEKQFAFSSDNNKLKQ